MDTLGKADPVAAPASPFHALMADRMVREGVLRRLDAGGYLAAVPAGDLPALSAMGAASPARIVPWEGILLAAFRTFPDVLDAEMRCTLLRFPHDFVQPDAFGPAIVTGGVPATPTDASRPATNDVTTDASGAFPSQDSTGMGDGLAGVVDDHAAIVFAERDEAGISPVISQMSRDVPEIERILRDVGLARVA